MHAQVVEVVVNFYILISILFIILIGVSSLRLWYWAGRRPLKHYH